MKPELGFHVVTLLFVLTCYSYGFPEVNIGILPGATGTQRFPRLTSLKLALDIIPTGRRIQAEEALKHGAIDQVTFTIGDIIPTGRRIQAEEALKHRAIDQVTFTIGDIIPTGRRIQAEEALKHRAIDQVTFTIGDIIPTCRRIQAERLSNTGP